MPPPPVPPAVAELLATLRDSAGLYARAAERIGAGALRARLAATARARAALAGELAIAAGEPARPSPHALAATRLRVAYADWCTRRRPDPRTAWLEWLEDVEDLVLDVADEALVAAAPAPFRVALAARLAGLVEDHDRALARKRAAAAGDAPAPAAALRRDGTGGPWKG